MLCSSVSLHGYPDPPQEAVTQVETLTAQIRAAQGPEINTMSGWLPAWGAPAAMSSMSGMNSGNNTGGGLSSAEMDRLGGLSGSALDREFPTMMINHHRGAIDMAKTEQAHGVTPARRTSPSGW